MKSTAMVWVPVCALLCAGACSTDTPAGSRRADAGPALPERARLRHASGNVLVKRSTGDDWTSAKGGLALFENDKVRTTAGASAIIDFANGSEVSVAEDALVTIAETHARVGQDRTDLTVVKGRIDAELEHPGRQSLSVSTPAATVRAGREIVFQ